MALSQETYREAVLLLQGILHAEDVYKRIRTLPRLPFDIGIKGARGLETYDTRMIGHDWTCHISALMVVPRPAIWAAGDMATLTFEGSEVSMLADLITAKFILPIWR